MEDETNICHLEETEDSGRSVLEFELNSDTNISIKMWIKSTLICISSKTARPSLC